MQAKTGGCLKFQAVLRTKRNVLSWSLNYSLMNRLGTLRKPELSRSTETI